MIFDVRVHQHITNRPHGADILYEHHSSFFFKLLSASQEAEAKFETTHPPPLFVIRLGISKQL
jgi:hypothetical protein